ncbi:uncharacterized protein BDV17DRAFT_79034 [Aspergillus undulatus]|uniref:uncharacterized protein n=1 Tax=Aspergillus undulatus TaxID=1810928 RepID=UPI003CCCFE9A
MINRPQFNTRSSPHDGARSGAASPRIEHFDGEIPPALSPLDAFAFQGRLLARQLEDSARRDRRLSRLPPASVARSLSRPRPGYFRSQSSNDVSRSSDENGLARQPTQKARPEPEEPRFRPQSEHPRLSGVSHLASEQNFSGDEDATPKYESPIAEVDNEGFKFDAVRAESPEEEPRMRASSEAPRRFYAASPTGFAGPGPTKASSTDSVSARLNTSRNLAPPASPMPRPSSSSRAPQTESSDDDYSSSNAGSTFSNPRKLSSSSAMSMPHSPMASMARPHPRSPSISSEASNSSHLPPRPSFNFSRPLSRSSTSLSSPIGLGVTEQPPASMQGAMNRINKPSPIVVPGPSEMPNTPQDEPSSAVSSYIYAKYSLPRGRDVPRDSVIFSGLQTPHFEWQEPLFESPEQQRPKTADPQRSARVPSPSPSRQESPPPPKVRSINEAPADDKLLTPVVSRSSAHTSPLPDKPEPENVSPRARSSETSRTDDICGTTSSADSASTLRPQTAKAKTSSAVVTAEEHVAKGIQLHEKGSLNESTYHLRVAAKQDHPVAMLLYALACRHGWGMRPNQQEGVRWLRKAMDSVGLELSSDSDFNVSAKSKELQKAYRAQFALSVYELGVSHLNGWGVEQDKPLALRCFETAGRWGDVDALAEAGYCYAEGIGCKKDMKKAAKFYREAEAKGMSMVGNSWIYKDKYMSDDGPDTRSRGRGRGRQAHSTPEKKGRSKSRTRSLFQRKKSNATEA